MTALDSPVSPTDESEDNTRSAERPEACEHQTPRVICGACSPGWSKEAEMAKP